MANEILNLFKKGLVAPPAITPVVYRFYLAPGENKRVIFLSGEDEFYSTYEHSVFDGTRRHFAVCLKVAGLDCYLCENKVSRGWVAYATILDVAGFVTKDNRKYSYVKRLYVLRKSVIERFHLKLKRLKERPGFNLKYAEFDIARSSLPNSPACGDDFEFIKVWTPAAKLEELVKAGYVKDLKPVDPATVVKVFKSYDEARIWYESVKPPEVEGGEIEDLDDGEDEIDF